MDKEINQQDMLDIQSIGEYGDLSPEERAELALETEKKFKNRSIDDIISLDIPTIQMAYKLIKSPEYKNLEMKTLINNLLEMIVDMATTSRELYNWQSNSYLRNVWGNHDTIDLTKSNDFASQIQAIQDKLSSDYSDILNLSDKQDANASETIKQIIKEIVTNSGIILEGTTSIEESIKTAISEIREYSVLTPFMNQPENVDFKDFVEEIRVDDYNDIRIVQGGREKRTDISFKSPEHAELFARKLIRSSGQPGEFSAAKPFLRVRVGATTRVSMMRDPIAIRDANLVEGDKRPVIHICIRRQRSDPFTADKLMELNSINKFGVMLLKVLLKSGISVCFYGGTGTGKTSMFNAFVGDISSGERMITMAEVDEMKARRIDYRKTIIDVNGNKVKNPNYRKAINSVLMWESTDMNREIAVGLSGYSGMFNAALTMTPYTIMMQETKGKEANDLIEAAISDHQVLTTIHAKDEKVLINRIFKMIQAGNNNTSEDVMFKDIVTAFPVVVGCSRLKDGSRKISSIVEYMGYIPTTKEIKTNTMMKYKVSANRYVNGKLKVYGDHKNYALPSTKLREEMESRGMLESDWLELETEFKNNKTPKPPTMDKTIYNGDLYQE